MKNLLIEIIEDANPLIGREEIEADIFKKDVGEASFKKHTKPNLTYPDLHQ